MDAYIGQFTGERDEDGQRLVVRNGSAEPRTVLTSAGAVEVTAPRVNDKRADPGTGERIRFSSAILPPWARKTPQLAEVLPLLYLHGLSSGDFVPGIAGAKDRRDLLVHNTIVADEGADDASARRSPMPPTERSCRAG